MHVNIAIHSVREGQEENLLQAMRTFGAAQAEHPGFIQAFGLNDPDSNRIFAVSIWESREQWDKALPVAIQSIDGLPFDDWHTQPTELLFGMDTLISLGTLDDFKS